MSVRPKLRFQILERDNFTCQYCGEQPPNVKLQVDHIKPVSKGGTDDPLNLITACHRCNIGKFTRPVQPPARRLAGPLRLTSEQWAMLDRLAECHWVTFHDWLERMEDEESLAQAIDTASLHRDQIEGWIFENEVFAKKWEDELDLREPFA